MIKKSLLQEDQKNSLTKGSKKSYWRIKKSFLPKDKKTLLLKDQKKPLT